MTKRGKQKPTQRDEPPDIFEQYGEGVKDALSRLILFSEPAASDYGYISAGEFVVDPRIERWLDAIDAADAGDKRRLLALRKSEGSIPDVIVPHLFDLMERWDWVKPKHRPRMPSYRLTDADIEMNAACCDVGDLVSAGKSIPDALREVAATRGLAVTKLHEFHIKRRTPDRRAKARSYKHRRRRAGK